MAQHDYSIANATGLAFRGDVNDALQAIVTTNSGATEPVVKFPGMLWLDLSGGGEGIVRRRNQANTGWVSDIGIDSTARAAAAAAQATADAALPKAGGTMTGAIVLPNAVPTGHQAVSRAQGDALYQVKLPTAIAGALLVGDAAGWTNPLTPGATGTVLSISGGVPVWQSTAQAAVPNALVRTKSDGTIDASFIPQVASGLKFCGTFKPIVGDEYPSTGDGGNGPSGAPAIGDFWVIDALTTSGYTYLSGSLAGVTVYNGDSIAYNGASVWYRMGSSVSLQGYMKLDGSTAMVGPLNMGQQAINSVGGLNGRAGTPVLQTNFRIDGTNIVISPQRGTTGADLAAMAAGQLGTDLGRMQLYVGTSGANQPLLPVTQFSTNATYGAWEYVKGPGATPYLFRAINTVNAGEFVQSQWARVMDEGGGSFIGHVSVVNGASFGWLRPNGITGIWAQMANGGAANECLAFGVFSDAGSLIRNSLMVQRQNGCVGIWTYDPTSPLEVAGTITSSGSNAAYSYFSRSAPGTRWTLYAADGYCHIYNTVFNGSGGNLVSFTDAGEMLCYGQISTTGPTNALRVKDRTGANYFAWYASNNIMHAHNGTNDIVHFNAVGSVYPQSDNAATLGGPSNRWALVYAANGTIQTSDAREKTDMRALNNAEHAAALQVMRDVCSYRWRNTDVDDKRHVGIAAQRVVEIFQAHGLDAHDYGLVVHDEWEGGERYGMRYDEVAMFCLAAIGSRLH